MNLQTAITQYVTYRKSLGEKFFSNEAHLKRFVRAIGQNKNLSDIKAQQVWAATGMGPPMAKVVLPKT